MTNFKKTPLHRVFECVTSEADRYGVPIVGSEIVGLTPAEALFMAADHYLRLERFSSDQVLEMRLLEERELGRSGKVWKVLGLSVRQGARRLLCPGHLRHPAT